MCLCFLCFKNFSDLISNAVNIERYNPNNQCLYGDSQYFLIDYKGSWEQKAWNGCAK